MAGQIISRGDRIWLVRMFMGRDHKTGKRKYHNHTIHGTKKDAQTYLNGALRDKDLGTFIDPKEKAEEPEESTLSEYLVHHPRERVRNC